ncbi:GNAT family N-acetyltransferase [Verminephrobacter eiseniae]|uniref:GNAT family N-acetyltransferase n=1 Tax=Verminephrobacter eiseniae TaxID=364317 RepID=UPI002237D552|nr:GNAT family N-acetyltransferase [Verminephrobacter eiseniae]MCW5231690.1 N-acetyltransferase [Verminephrobacter eiseniae]MCW5293421.1 N-acetyltransferase [Verminephrobacter eiseniae]MCW8187922.1 N-acetyltransferase [Verminephrobacter eiseniae]MCW8226205.1 N-acetyltransferase [Verminephrobacter eiseniae]MCW8237068.1 N-acetyltransferase [Verminephrobacter eiseniae]
MALPVFDAAWRGKQRLKPSVCALEVRDRAKPDGEPIARLFVQREESYRRDDRDRQMYEASISLSYQTIEPKHSFRSPVSGSFDASYSRGFLEGEASVSLVDGALFFDPAELRGQRIGTYLMNEIVTWAQQWPDAKVRSIKLLSGQAHEDNRDRRNRFYERFGLKFAYSDPAHEEGLSKPMPAKELTPVTTWEANIRERDPREYLAELLYERDSMALEASRRDTVIKNLSARLEEANSHPIRWAARRLWWRLQPILVQGAMLLALGALVWIGLRSR